jgi:predicted lipid-binding transport protein (Tim44 family)
MEQSMKKAFLIFCTAILALGLSINSAEAARLGGSRSFGMQRQSVSPRPAAPQQATPVAPSAPVGVPTTAPKRNWMGMVGGLAAGLGIAALLSHFGMGEGLSSIVMIVLLAVAAVFVFKLLFRRTTPPAQAAGYPEPLHYSAADDISATTPSNVVPIGAAAPSSANIPADFDSEGFLRIAKLNFVRLQAANDAKNLDDIRDFVSPELHAEIKLQMDERGNVPQRTDVVTLNAELLEIATEGSRHIASVHFSGMIREVADAAAAPFNEIWNLSKPTDGSKGWIIAGIQQVN